MWEGCERDVRGMWEGCGIFLCVGVNFFAIYICFRIFANYNVGVTLGYFIDL